MKKGAANIRQSEKEYDVPVVAAESELSELVILINDEINAGLRVQQEESFPVAKSDEQESIGRYICIELAGKQLAIPLTSILETGKLQTLQPLPLLPPWLIGITNLLGEIVSVINLTMFLDGNTLSHGEGQSFLVVHNDTIKLAIIIDRIIGTRSLYSLPTETSETVTNEMLMSDYFAGQAVYEEQDIVREVTLFDLTVFFLPTGYETLQPDFIRLQRGQ